MSKRRQHRAEPDKVIVASQGSEDAARDPLLAALAAAELDDEPYTEEERAAAQAGWEEYLRGEVASWEDVRRALLDDAAAKTSTS